MELHNTGYGRKLLESDIPGIRKALERIADALEDKELIKVNNQEGVINLKIICEVSPDEVIEDFIHEIDVFLARKGCDKIRIKTEKL